MRFGDRRTNPSGCFPPLMPYRQLDTTWAWAVALIVIVALLADVRHDIRRLVRGRSSVLAGILSWFVFEGITLSPGLNEFAQATYNYAIFCVLLSAAGFLAGYHLLTPTFVADRIASHLRPLDNPELLWRVVLVCGILGFAPIV